MDAPERYGRRKSCSHAAKGGGCVRYYAEDIRCSDSRSAIRRGAEAQGDGTRDRDCCRSTTVFATGKEEGRGLQGRVLPKPGGALAGMERRLWWKAMRSIWGPRFWPKEGAVPSCPCGSRTGERSMRAGSSGRRTGRKSCHMAVICTGFSTCRGRSSRSFGGSTS